jgi:hypothetical protein
MKQHYRHVVLLCEEGGIYQRRAEAGRKVIFLPFRPDRN